MNLVVGKDKHQWAHTAAVMAVIINVNRDPKTRPVSARELNPYCTTKFHKGLPVNKETIRDVTAMFCTPEQQQEAMEQAKRNKAAAEALRQRLLKRRAG